LTSERPLLRIRRFSLTRNTVLLLVTAVLLAASCELSLQLKHRNDKPGTSSAAQTSRASRASQASPGDGIRVRSGRLHFERIGNPARTVARDPRGTVIATFTDGARTGVMTGPSRTFGEPRTTDAKVVTKSWVRLLPKPWARGAEQSAWFKNWLRARLGSRDPDILATAFDYVAGAPRRTAHAPSTAPAMSGWCTDTARGSR
jgi:hypothetical protein